MCTALHNKDRHKSLPYNKIELCTYPCLTIQHHTTPCSTIQHHKLPYNTILLNSAPYSTKPHCKTTQYNTKLHHKIRHHTMPTLTTVQGGLAEPRAKQGFYGCHVFRWLKWYGRENYTVLYGMVWCFMQPTPPPPERGRLGVGCFRKMIVCPPM